MPENASGGSSSSSSLLIRSKNPRRCQAENPLKLLSEFAGPALTAEQQGMFEELNLQPGDVQRLQGAYVGVRRSLSALFAALRSSSI